MKAPDVGPQKVQDSLGVKLRVPEGWTREEKQNVLELQSRRRRPRCDLSTGTRFGFG